MNPGQRTLGDATLTIGVCRALPNEMRAQTRELSALFVPIESRKAGHATELMHDVCSEADEAGITLVLFVNPFDEPDLSRAQIADWYTRRFGFVPIQADPMLMARMPGSTPRYLTGIAKAVAEAVQ